MQNFNRVKMPDYNSERATSNRNPYKTVKKSKTSRRPNSKTENFQSCNEPISEFSPFQWNQPSQRLYPTMSDSAVCGYPIPINIPIDPRYHALYPMYQPCVPIGFGRDYIEPDSQTRTRDQFTSLPPINVIDNDSEIKRTHSDPGLNNSDDKFELMSSESDQESIETCYANEMAELKKDNQRLSNELELIKIELQNLKLEISSKNTDICACADAGSFTTIIQEIRAAHKLMEETLESKFKLLITNISDSSCGPTQMSTIYERLAKLENANKKGPCMKPLRTLHTDSNYKLHINDGSQNEITNSQSVVTDL
ncbi:uncharacterized protein LOC126843202 isoform X1 [Adelges cooleyi]|uniref:uncharacterized protein LOC126843202 isoform X1 n=1 Tax=Adelges cooleyi TaxID=133065 RepID=UPI00217FF25E|nr:uncharacterized protein LOC126843202 isoform X1 [Adelges cooleyi]